MSPQERIAAAGNATLPAPSLGERAGQSLRLPVRLTAPVLRSALTGIIQDFLPGEMSVLFEEPLQRYLRVWLEFNGIHVEGEVLNSRPAGDKYEIHIVLYDTDENGRRRSLRFPVRIPARVYCPGNEIPVRATIVDVSAEGLGIEIVCAIAPEQVIAVDSDASLCFGTVRHCRPLEQGFHAGVQLLSVIAKEAHKRFSLLRRNR